MRLATGLMYLGAGLTVLSAVIAFAMTEQLADSFAEDNPLLGRASVDQAVDELQARAVVRTIVGVTLWVWMAIKNGQGRKWARVVATVFGIVQLAGIVLGGALVAGVGDDEVGYVLPSLVVDGAVAVLAIVILVQLYRPASSRYYDETARWQAAMTLGGYG
jgi:hypothetical protein